MIRKTFNTTGCCDPDLHYMVDLSSRLKEIKSMIDRGEYFTINRARQYGKTTTLQALAEYLADDYEVLSIDFQTVSYVDFESEQLFVAAFSRELLECTSCLPENIKNKLMEYSQGASQEVTLSVLFKTLMELCRNTKKKIVLLIDEVDSATNNQVFLDFLAQLRAYFLKRKRLPTFQSVILAGVYDIRNIRRKLRPEDEHKTNSPWNTRVSNEENGSLLTFDDCTRDQMELAPFDIAADFLIDMSFSCQDIMGMLEQYESDYQTGMDIGEIASLLYDYTSGYPYLVSRLCKLLDEQIAGENDFPEKSAAWTAVGVSEAVRRILIEKNTLFESLNNKIVAYPKLRELLYQLLMNGKTITYAPDSEAIDIAMMFGFVKATKAGVVVSNRIFETRLYNFFLSSEEMQGSDMYTLGDREKYQFIKNGELDMTLILKRFVTAFDDIYGDQPKKFIEEDGRRYFLLYLRPIINGTGNYYIESRTRNQERTDVIIDYHGRQYVIELKIWRGDSYHTRGEKQLLDYLGYYHLDKGYMLSFNFNKQKEIGVRKIVLGDKVLIEAVV
ncbi:MAG: AAA-like domain-containing protein [Clostridiales bacterium]|nr:AAA-like domain-containing protein [Clostridiales bacterium]